MQVIEEIYRARLRLLVGEAGSQKALAERVGKAPAQISQWINASKDSRTGKPRAMDRKTAREIEEKFPKPEGWMDQPLEAAAPAVEAPFAITELERSRWRMSISDDDAFGRSPFDPANWGLPDVVNALGDALEDLSYSDREHAVDLCTTLAKAPDSESVREKLGALLATESVRPMRTWRHMAAMMADRWPNEAQREVIETFLAAVDRFAVEHSDTPPP